MLNDASSRGHKEMYTTRKGVGTISFEYNSDTPFWAYQNRRMATDQTKWLRNGPILATTTFASSSRRWSTNSIGNLVRHQVYQSRGIRKFIIVGDLVCYRVYRHNRVTTFFPTTVFRANFPYYHYSLLSSRSAQGRAHHCCNRWRIVCLWENNRNLSIAIKP